MAKTFDPAKPHGIIIGAGDGRAYEQDGLFFTATGAQWVEPAAEGEAAPAKPVKPKPLSKVADADPASPVDTELAAQMGQQ